MTPEEILTRESEHQRIRASRYRDCRQPDVLRIVAGAWPDWLLLPAQEEAAESRREAAR